MIALLVDTLLSSASPPADSLASVRTPSKLTALLVEKGVSQSAIDVTSPAPKATS